MSLSLGALAVLAGGSALGNLAGSGVSYLGNRSLQQMSQDYNSAEAIKSRDFNASEAEKARAFSALEAIKSRDFNASEAQKARDFQEHLAATNYQRTIADMEKAGINPAALGSSFAATGSGSAGASASASNAASVTATGSAASVGTGHFNSASNLFGDAFFRALAYDKSFAESFADNLQHSAIDARRDIHWARGVLIKDLNKRAKNMDYQTYRSNFLSILGKK